MSFEPAEFQIDTKGTRSEKAYMKETMTIKIPAMTNTTELSAGDLISYLKGERAETMKRPAGATAKPAAKKARHP